MRCLIIGMGNFGKSLATQLSNLGNEVIVVDNNPIQLEYVKDKVSGSYILDATDHVSISSLPVKDIDIAVVAIGKNMAASLRCIVLLKNLKLSRIYARSIDEIHESIINAIGGISILNPEIDSAKLYANRFSKKDIGLSLE